MSKICYFPHKLIQGIEIPERFNYPYNYEPHPLCIIAAHDLQTYISENFGYESDFSTGKMFGVLVIQDKDGKIGYISGFSGKLNNSNQHERFVPAIFDMLDTDGFYRRAEQELNDFSQKMDELNNHPDFIRFKKDFEKYKQEAENEISDFKKRMKQNKAERHWTRENQKPLLSNDDFQKLETELKRQSNLDQFKFKILKRSWKNVIEKLEIEIQRFKNQIDDLKNERKQKSNRLQNRLFEQYSFLNQFKEKRSLISIFKETVFEKPPSGAGECAAPKMLQYAFQNDLKPLVFAEFWYGASPESEIRKHLNFYPACSGKCRPILKHMLKGMAVEENPILENLAKEKQLEIVFEDEWIAVVNKPTDLLSVPGIEIKDSVYSRLQEIWKDTEPLIVHRLDMSTSGLMVVAKTKESYKKLQNQFLKQTVKKRYTALLSGIPNGDKGEISLPLRADILDRPRQVVDLENGKKAMTIWKMIQKTDGIAQIHFWPKTGRTHQLRVHAAHPLGLNCPIVGDELYGQPGERLYLHAGFLEFEHPTTGELLQFEESAKDFPDI